MRNDRAPSERTVSATTHFCEWLDRPPKKVNSRFHGAASRVSARRLRAQVGQEIPLNLRPGVGATGIAPLFEIPAASARSRIAFVNCFKRPFSSAIDSTVERPVEKPTINFTSQLQILLHAISHHSVDLSRNIVLTQSGVHPPCF